VVMLDPMTGEVLAMANYPSVDPGNLAAALPGNSRTASSRTCLKPVPVFKIVTRVRSAERGVVKPESKYLAENGSYVVRYGRSSRTITDVPPHGTLSSGRRSSSQQHRHGEGVDRSVRRRSNLTARNYGFGVESGIELPG